ncbi:glycosyltransferase family 9 protein [Pseudoalteromonas holothuriae]|uniref:glycosyltransferase family 9 protein n=1 Tax=Pseudoalteromonas holothuriae TaxID=2963714 RepID=UPI0021C116CD|nr:glycosyltransferase family 9 protein [Pseudoalteromonas sp. CIP111951]
MKPLHTKEVNSPILVVLPKFIGDAINTLPALKLLRQLYPAQKIVILANGAICELFKKVELANSETLSLNSFGKKKWSLDLIKALRKFEFALGFLFRGSLGDAILCKMAGIKTLIGYAQNGRSALLSHALPLNINQHYITRYCRLVNEPHGNPFKCFESPKLSHAHIERAFQSEQKVISVYMGSANKNNRYYPSHYAKEALLEISKHSVCSFNLLGSCDEAFENSQLCDLLKADNIAVTDLSGKTSITELVDTIAQSDLMISIDSGPMHIACATGVNCITLVGPGTSPWSCVQPVTPYCKPIFANPLLLNDSDKLSSISPSKLALLAINTLNSQNQGNSHDEYPIN